MGSQIVLFSFSFLERRDPNPVRAPEALFPWYSLHSCSEMAAEKKKPLLSNLCLPRPSLFYVPFPAAC